MKDLRRVKVVTMTSREIAEIVGEEHMSVARAIKKLLTGLSKDSFKYERFYLDSMNMEQAEFELPKNIIMALMEIYDKRIGFVMAAHIEALEGELSKKQKDLLLLLNDLETRILMYLC